MAAGKKKRKGRIVVGTVAVVMALLIVGASLFVLKVLLRDDSQRRKRQIQMVTLVKPPPPPKIREKPPEPEIKKKEEIVEPEPEEPEPEPEASDDQGPTDDDLGLDADGTAGADGFGLRGKKGGRALIGGTFSERSLLQKYAWYTRILQDEIRERVKAHLEEDGGIPDGDLTAFVRIELDAEGRVLDHDIYGSSGNHRMDRALAEVLQGSRISEPPPEGMPTLMKLKISAKG